MFKVRFKNVFTVGKVLGREVVLFGGSEGREEVLFLYFQFKDSRKFNLGQASTEKLSIKLGSFRDL